MELESAQRSYVEIFDVEFKAYRSGNGKTYGNKFIYYQKGSVK